MKKTFTLIELLVVLAIIGILASILIPSLTKARKMAKIAVEISNRKQLAQATFIYAGDNDEFLPYRGPVTFLHEFRAGNGIDLNDSLLIAYMGNKDGLRDELFFCDSSLLDIRNPKTAKYRVNDNPNYGTVSFYNIPPAGVLLEPDFDNSTLGVGDPGNPQWSCLTITNTVWLAHDVPKIEVAPEGASTSYMDGSAKWVYFGALKPLWRGGSSFVYYAGLKD